MSLAPNQNRFCRVGTGRVSGGVSGRDDPGRFGMGREGWKRVSMGLGRSGGEGDQRMSFWLCGQGSAWE